MQYAVALPTGGECGDVGFLVELGVRAEESGWDSEGRARGGGIDRLSGGRLVVGFGSGDAREPGFTHTGEPLDDRVRAELLDEGLDARTTSATCVRGPASASGRPRSAARSAAPTGTKSASRSGRSATPARTGGSSGSGRPTARR
jgi:hypothetical protein